MKMRFQNNNESVSDVLRILRLLFRDLKLNCFTMSSRMARTINHENDFERKKNRMLQNINANVDDLNREYKYCFNYRKIVNWPFPSQPMFQKLTICILL